MNISSPSIFHTWYWTASLAFESNRQGATGVFLSHSYTSRGGRTPWYTHAGWLSMPMLYNTCTTGSRISMFGSWRSGRVRTLLTCSRLACSESLTVLTGQVRCVARRTGWKRMSLGGVAVRNGTGGGKDNEEKRMRVEWTHALATQTRVTSLWKGRSFWKSAAFHNSHCGTAFRVALKNHERCCFESK